MDASNKHVWAICRRYYGQVGKSSASFCSRARPFPRAWAVPKTVSVAVSINVTFPLGCAAICCGAGLIVAWSVIGVPIFTLPAGEIDTVLVVAILGMIDRVPVSVPVLVENIEMRGEPRTYVKRGDSGDAVTTAFCPDCGSRLFSTNLDSFPGLVFVMLGSLDRPELITPKLEMFTKRRLKWNKPLDMPQFESMPG